MLITYPYRNNLSAYAAGFGGLEGRHTWNGPTSVPVEGFGSQELAEVTNDFNATVRALAENPVALPVAFDDYGRLRLVAHRREDEDFLRLSVYSTSAAVHADLERAGPLFIIRHGASVIRFLDEHSERILFVSVDPASCLRLIEFPAGLPQYFATMPPPRRADRREEGSGWGSGAAGEGPPPTGFVLDLSDDWVRVGLTVGAEELKARVDGLIAEQTRQWPTTMGWLRERTRSPSPQPRTQKDRNQTTRPSRART